MKIALLTCLDGKYPPSCDIISRPYLPHVDEIKKKPRCQPTICTPDFLLPQTVYSILVLLELMLPFAHEISFWLLFLQLFRR